MLFALNGYIPKEAMPTAGYAYAFEKYYTLNLSICSSMKISNFKLPNHLHPMGLLQMTLGNLALL
jgi:hypothetical protein